MRSRWTVAAVVLACLAGIGAMLMVTNPAPEVPVISSADAAEADRPYVIKLHARWCPVCLATKGIWTTVQDAYAGKVRLVVFDFTSAATTETSRTEAGRLGLTAVFEEYVGETGTILVLDGATREVRHAIHGSRDPAEYRAAIDATLARTGDRDADIGR